MESSVMKTKFSVIILKHISFVFNSLDHSIGRQHLIGTYNDVTNHDRCLTRQNIYQSTEYNITDGALLTWGHIIADYDSYQSGVALKRRNKLFEDASIYSSRQPATILEKNI
jgi:hypothetical protein